MAAPQEGSHSSARVLDAGCAGSSYSTIQSAINASVSGDVIEVCAGTYHERLTITARSVTIKSKNGASGTVIDAQGLGRALSIRNGANVVVDGFTLRNGLSSANGGNFYCTDSTLDLKNSVLTGGQANMGGGLASNLCTGRVRNNVFEDNTATAAGGGAFARGDALDFENNVLRSNIAVTSGGGLHVAGSPDVHNNIFEYNTADRGGGAFIKGSVGSIVGNTVTGNVALDDGGGIYISDGNPLVDDNRFEANEADSEGGGLRVKVAEAVITNNLFLENHADWRGGGARISHDEVVMAYNTWIGNNSWGTGGALLLFESASHLSYETYQDNVADHGGAIAILEGWGSVVIEDSVFTGNRGRDEGGHLWIDLLGFNTTLRRVELIDGESDVGGAVWAFNTGVILENTLLDGNIADVSGGGLYLDGANGRVVNSVIYASEAPEGAAMTVANALTALDVRNTVFHLNTGGAAVHVPLLSVPPNIRYSDFNGNTLDFLGMFSVVGSNGNLSSSPNFVNPSAGDFHLQSSSALINAGDPAVSDTNGTRSDIGLHGGPQAD